LERILIKGVIGTKLFLGVGLGPEPIQQQKYADEIHKQFIKPRHLLKVQVGEIDDIWSADLVDMPKENLGKLGKYRYILTVIDLYSRYAWAVPLKTKTGSEVKSAFESIFKSSNRKPKQLWVDQGKEFYNSQVQPLFKRVYSTHNDGKAVVVERFNRTLKNMMWKEFTIQGHQKWLKLLPELLHKYNNKVHSSIKETPTNASKKPSLIENINRDNNNYNEHYITKNKPKFKIGQRVRIYKWKTKFEKGYVGYWTEEVFRISEILHTTPLSYKIRALDEEEIIGTFYQNELQATDM
jgi:integrase-like protein